MTARLKAWNRFTDHRKIFCTYNYKYITTLVQTNLLQAGYTGEALGCGVETFLSQSPMPAIAILQ